MPCTLQPWEIEYEERRANKEKFGLDMTDNRVSTAVACAAFKALEAHDLLNGVPQWALRWWEEHKKQDAEREREKPSR
jgi:hypothetical protein